MGLIGAEMRKIFGSKLFPVLLAIFLTVNSVLCYYETDTYLEKNPSRQFLATFSELCVKCTEDEGYYDELFKKYSDLTAEWFFGELAKQAADPNYVIDMNWSPTVIDGVSRDKDLILCLEPLVEKRSEYTGAIGRFSDQALKEMDALRSEGVSTDSYVYRYQVYVYNQYKHIQENTDFPVAPVHGWNDYFSYTSGNIFIFSIVIVLAGLVFIPEKQRGLLPIIRSTKKGRMKTGLAKMTVLSILSIVITLLFTLSAMWAIYLKTGFASPDIPMQCIDGMMSFPFNMTVLEYYFVSLGLKTLSIAAFSACVAFLSVIFYGHMLTFVSGISLFAVSSLLCSVSDPSIAYLRVANFVSLSEALPIVTRFYSLNIFGYPALFLPTAAVVSLGVMVTSSICTSLLYSEGSRGVSIGIFNKLLNKLRVTFRKSKELYNKKTEKRPQKVFDRSIYRWECGKILFYGKTWVLIAVFLLISLFLAYEICESYIYNKEYHVYLEDYGYALEGEMTQEKREYVELELETWRELKSKVNEIERQYQNAEISLGEYREFMKKYNEYKEKEASLDILETRHGNLAKKQDEEGITGWYVDDEAIREILFADFNVPVFGVMIIISIISFSMEYTGKNKNNRFLQILRTTKKVRVSTLIGKYSAVILMSLLAGLIFYLIEGYAYYKTYAVNTSLFEAPLCSLEGFGDVNSDITVLEYIVFNYTGKFSAILLTALFAVSISVITENLLSGLSISIFTTMIPSFIGRVGLDALKYMDFSSWFSVNGYFLVSAKADLFGWDFGAWVLFTVVFTVITAILMFFAVRKIVR